MTLFKRYILPLLIILTSLFCFYFFKVTQVQRLWSGYSLLYVSRNSDMTSVYKCLEKHSIKNYICLDNQFIPLNLADQSPEIRLSLSWTKEKSAYLSERNSYFFDKDKIYSVIYVPEKYSSKLPGTLEELKSMGIKGGLNASTNYPFLAPLATILLAVFLVFYSADKVKAAFLFSLPVYFSFFVPTYQTAAALCLFMFSYYLTFRILGRKNALQVLKKSMLFIVLSAISLISMLLSSVKIALLFILLLLSSLALLSLYDNVKNLLDNYRYSFNPVKIRTAGMIRLVTKKSRFCLLVTGFFISFITVFSFVSISFSFPSEDGQVSLPSPAAREKVLPQLSDFVNWRWESLIYPYISINSSESILPKEGNTVYFPRFIEEDGRIKESLTSITYNQKFKEESISSIDSLDYPAIEKVLKKQGRMKAGFSSSVNARPSFFSIILMIFSAGAVFVFYFIITNPKFRGRA